MLRSVKQHGAPLNLLDLLRCVRPLLVLWTAPPPARRLEFRLGRSRKHKTGGWDRIAPYIRLVMSELVMKDLGFALFETAIGHCGIVWSERGVAGAQLPERNEHATRNRIVRRFPAARAAVPADGMRRALDDSRARPGAPTLFGGLPLQVPRRGA